MDLGPQSIRQIFIAALGGASLSQLAEQKHCTPQYIGKILKQAMHTMLAPSELKGASIPKCWRDPSKYSLQKARRFRRFWMQRLDHTYPVDPAK